MPCPDLAQLTELAGVSAFQRGTAYARAGAVEIADSSNTVVSAYVHGSHRYCVELAWHEGRLRGQCDCPVGQRQQFCKHQVAAALV